MDDLEEIKQLIKHFETKYPTSKHESHLNMCIGYFQAQRNQAQEEIQRLQNLQTENLPAETSAFLIFETDYDFSIKYKNKVLIDYQIDLRLTGPEELEHIELLGPYGTPLDDKTKCYEAIQGLTRIKANPSKHFSNRGGNRGVEWFPPK